MHLSTLSIWLLPQLVAVYIQLSSTSATAIPKMQRLPFLNYEATSHPLTTLSRPLQLALLLFSPSIKRHNDLTLII
jgi:hypothetical protein